MLFQPLPTSTQWRSRKLRGFALYLTGARSGLLSPAVPRHTESCPCCPQLWLISPGTHTFANPLPQITQLRHLLGIKGYSTVGTCLGQLQPKPSTGMGQPAPDALLFPLVDALVPWQLLKPNSCGESTASEQLRSPVTVAMSWGFFFPPKNPRQRMCIWAEQSQTALCHPCTEPKTHFTLKSSSKKITLP